MKIEFETKAKLESFARANGLCVVNNFISGKTLIDIYINKDLSINVSPKIKWRGLENAKKRNH